MADNLISARSLEDLIYLIRCGLEGQPPEPGRVEKMDLPELYRFSSRHSLAALTYTALESAWRDVPPAREIPAGWKEARERALRGSILFSAERKALLDWCEEQGIWYLPLKGILMQAYYPRLGMREMADNDILFDPAFREQVHGWFLRRGYTAEQYGLGVHDAYHKPPIFNFEMHIALFDDERYPQWREYLAHIQERLLPQEGTRFGYRLSDEDFYLYMMAHMYKHFRGGGTGLRSLVDCWVFERARADVLDWAYLDREGRQMGLEEFVSQTRALVRGLFGENRALTAEERELLSYYLTSGTYGTLQHRVQNQLDSMADGGKKAGQSTKLRYLVRRIFPQRAFMVNWCKGRAPFFLRHPRLMPLAWIYRLFYQCARGSGKKGWREVQTLWKL